MNPVLLGLGLAAGFAVIIAGLVLMLIKKHVLSGACVALAGVALIGGMVMLWLMPPGQNSSNEEAKATDTPAATATPEGAFNTDNPTETEPGTPGGNESPTPGETEAVVATPEPTVKPTDTPAPTPTVEPGKYMEVHYDASTIVKPSNWNGATVYLTFDDGPSVVTGEILDELKKYNVKATFFVVGREIRDDTIQYIRRALEEGHSVGIHTNTHDYSIVYKSVDAFLEDFYAVDKILKEQLNYRPLISRFPGGGSNMRSADYCEGIMTALTKKLPELGYAYFDWNVSPEDAMEILDTDVIADAVLSGLRVGYGENVVLMHDFDKMHNTAKALGTIIEQGLEKGYAFDRLTPETTPVRHKVFN